MSFDKPTRNALANMVGECRRLLTEDVRHQLQATYGLQPDGTALPASSLGHLDEHGHEIAQELREWQEHLASTEVGTETEKKKAAFERLAHETAFTVLNRLAALRMCEERGHVIECVRRGMESDGFVLYERSSGGALGTRGEAYRIFLERMFDELAVDLGALFDLRAPQSLVFPRERCLEEVLALLNDVKLAHLWKEDETIGWVYQYFNSKEERERMREESAAPRNSRELAVRNQFFTPRYVVEFLVDNTLGRIWYEMRKGETATKHLCRYLVRRPAEIFLRKGAEPPTQAEPQENLSQEDLLKQPAYIPHCPKKDPRDLKILDPACGSGHFLLYCFDLLETIYEEAWADEQPMPSEATGKSLRQDFPDLDSLKKALPELILRDNLHGIDIDLRACQIAALALWLRAQRTCQRQGLKGADRPRITKSNIVCAEPMPGEEAFLEQFLARLEPKVIGQLVQAVFEKMKLAGEAGSLLKIEEEIAGAVVEAKKEWLARPKAEQTRLFADDKRAEQKELGLDFSGITDAAFWEKAEGCIYAALKAYAERAENGYGYQRHLFAEDAARGFAFIDICRIRYDIILMNPPFGEAATASQAYVDATFTESKTDVFGASVMRGLSALAPLGRLGAITNRLGFFNSQFEDWRNEALMGSGRLVAAADLGYGVLDAMVETAAYIVSTNDSKQRATICSLLRAEAKDDGLLAAIQSLASGELPGGVYLVDLEIFRLLTGHPICYWIPESTLRKLAAHPPFENETRTAKQGLATADDFRFVFATWEVPSELVSRHWFYFAKGGEYSPFWDDIHLVINWREEGAEAKAFAGTLYNNSHWSRILKNVDFYFRPGLTYPERTTSDFGPRVLPQGCVFSATGQAIFHDSSTAAKAFLGVCLSRPYRLLLELFIGSGDAVVSGSAARHYKSGIINTSPVPEFDAESQRTLSDRVGKCIRLVVERFSAEETTRYFIVTPIRPNGNVTSLKTAVESHRRNINENSLQILGETWEIDKQVCNAYRLDASDTGVLRKEYGCHPCELSPEVSHPSEEEITELWNLDEDSIVDLVANRLGKSRQITKKSFYADRKIELLCHYFGIHPTAFVLLLNRWSIISKAELIAAVASHISYLLGCVFGRWDIRFATGEKKSSGLPDPFAPLPICPPGMVQSGNGLPLTEDDVRRLQAASQWDYPIEIPWHGLLVDDPGPDGTQPHRDDIVRRVRAVLAVIWKDLADAIEQEACEILGVKDLREYFRKAALFFADHLKRYSKSRRQAPIYWPLSTTSGSYTLWIYYHRLNDQTLYTALNKYVKPKIDDIEKELRWIESDLPSATGREASKLREAFEDAKAFLEELRELRDELLRVAGLPYKPNLNDGVLITASPLSKLFRLPKWRKDLEECWGKLAAGNYDWAHLAYSIWPDRVREVCKHDRSIAIAHGLEEFCEVQAKPTKIKRSRRPKEEAEERVLGDEE